MDQYIHAYRANLKLAEQAMVLRHEAVLARPKGMVLRENQATHILALITLIKELRLMAEHDDQTWWVEEEYVPF